MGDTFTCEEEEQTTPAHVFFSWMTGNGGEVRRVFEYDEISGSKLAVNSLDYWTFKLHV